MDKGVVTQDDLVNGTVPFGRPSKSESDDEFLFDDDGDDEEDFEEEFDDLDAQMRACDKQLKGLNLITQKRTQNKSESEQSHQPQDVKTDDEYDGDQGDFTDEEYDEDEDDDDFEDEE